MASLLELAQRIHAEERGDLPDDPEERAAEVARALALERPETKTRSQQTAAAKAVGIDPPLTPSQQTEVLTEDADRRSVRGRARRARSAGRTVGRRTAGARRGARRAGRAILRAPARAISGATSVRGIIGQALALVVLYWLLRTAARRQGADFLEGVVSGLRRPFEWLFSSGGVPAAEGPAITQPDTGGPDGAGAPNPAAASAVAEWTGLVARYFPPSQISKALRVIWCESRGNPDAVNPSSQASGLFQHLPQFWPQRSQAAGFAGASIFDPEANVATAAWLYTRDGWRHWPNCGKL